MQTRRDFLTRAGAGTLAASALAASNCAAPPADKAAQKPNFVILFCDDLGYGDWNRGGHPTINTPNLNRMADEGVHLTQFYCGNPVCSPSRACLLTGRNAIRNGVIQVFFPGNGTGLSTEEVTIADALKPLGYRTACVGKWHLGSTEEYRPLKQGFDYYYGILYSNDMYHPDVWRNEERIEHPSDQTTLTRRYTEEAVKFIEESGDEPFFLYLPYTFPHTPLFASDRFLDTSQRGLYGDVVEEIDWSVGQILGKLKELGLDEETLVFFSSDNGPWGLRETHGGSAGILRGNKGDTWEGGMRVPTVAWWPGRLPAGKVNMTVGSQLDFFPTLVNLAGGAVPTDRPYDGIDLMPTLEGTETPERTIYFYRGNELRAVRKGPWKIHFSYWEHPATGWSFDEGLPDYARDWKYPEKPLLFDLDIDPGEVYDIAAENPEKVAELTAIAEAYKKDVASRGENAELIRWFMEDWATAPREGE